MCKISMGRIAPLCRSMMMCLNSLCCYFISCRQFHLIYFSFIVFALWTSLEHKPGLDIVGGSTSSGDTAATTATTFAGAEALSPVTLKINADLVRSELILMFL